MPFDEDRWDQPAMSGEVGYIAVVVRDMLLSVSNALARIAHTSHVDVSGEIDALTKELTVLDDFSKKLTGWRPNDDR